MYVNTPKIRNFGFENRVQILLFEWKCILIALRGFIDRFWQNNFTPKSRYGVQNRSRALLEPAIRAGSRIDLYRCIFDLVSSIYHRAEENSSWVIRFYFHHLGMQCSDKLTPASIR